MMRAKNWKIIVFILVIVISVFSLTGCENLTGNTSPTTTTLTTTVTTTTPSPIDTTWTPPSTSNINEELPAIAEVIALVKPAVVSINTEVITQSIFGEFSQEGAGSGWIIDPNGIIVTNNHVVEGASTITATLDDGRIFTVDPESVHTDPLNDLAIFRIDATNLPTIDVGDSRALRVGDWVVAIGNSLGLGIRATEGIVSRLGVSLPVDQDQTLYNLLETTAVINPGNSGGPLVNLSGEVVGITSAKIAQVGVEGTGFAISTETALPIIEQLVTNGYVIRPWLGVSVTALTPQVKAIVEMNPEYDWDITVDQGILLIFVAEDSPAEKAG
ncbi:MAG: trypsin-like peptidase domain-containing protein, partial [Dehalococcoidia bacterium]